MTREPIKDFYGKILGWIETDDQGNKVAKDFYGKILGKYRKDTNKTYDFYGRILFKGVMTSALLTAQSVKK